MTCKRIHLLETLLCVAWAATLISCGGEAVAPPPTPNPVPLISAVVPTTAIAGSGAFALMVNGSGFVSGAVVRWNGSNRPTTFVSSTQLNAAIPASDIASGGTAQVQVFNPAPGGGTTGAAAFTISNPAPTISALSPSTAVVGTQLLTLVVSGSNFVPASLVQWNGTARPTTFQSSTQISATIPASDLAAVGTATITVVNSAPGGGTSNSFPLSTNNPSPLVTSFSPASAPAGSSTLTLTLDGLPNSFVPSVEVRWNGSLLPSTVVSSSRVTTTIPASDLANPGDADIEVANPAPSEPPGSFHVSFIVNPASDIGVTERISVASDGTQANGDSSEPSVSGDGRFVAFASSASNLVSGDTNAQRDVFLRDTCFGAPAGCIPSTVRVSVATDGTQGNGGSGSAAIISSDGRFVAFLSEASNLVSGDTNGATDVFVRDTCFSAPAGCIPSTVRVSVATDGTQANGESFLLPGISMNGRFIVFESFASNLIPSDANGTGDVFVRDTCAGAPAGCTPSTIRASVDVDGSEISSNGAGVSTMSDNGRFVGFVKFGNFYDGSQDRLLLRDTCNEAPSGCSPTTSLIWEVSPSGLPNSCGFIKQPSISAEGRFAAFTTNFYPDCDYPDRFDDVSLVDDCLGAPAECTPSGIEVSVLPNLIVSRSYSDALVSSDGRFVVYVNQSRTGTEEILVFDSCQGATGCTPTTFLLSVASDGTPANDASSSPSLSADGRFVAFVSRATNLVVADSNGAADIFLARTGRP